MWLFGSTDPFDDNGPSDSRFPVVEGGFAVWGADWSCPAATGGAELLGGAGLDVVGLAEFETAGRIVFVRRPDADDAREGHARGDQDPGRRHAGERHLGPRPGDAGRGASRRWWRPCRG
ncbi:hypothetical protein [Lentzea indica]|uniref:hypothetical protein n=1 Tax=Lentzea indica TaxID=2604800 RepID=UPI001FEACE0F|nr:hypothetical protein [Lentzea indica]